MGIIGGEGVRPRVGGGEGVRRGGIGREEKSVVETAGWVNILSFWDWSVLEVASVMFVFRCSEVIWISSWAWSIRVSIGRSAEL